MLANQGSGESPGKNNNVIPQHRSPPTTCSTSAPLMGVFDRN
jgi:hypothetical protein